MFSTTWAVDSAEAMVDVSAAQRDLEAACASDDELKGVVCALLAFEAPQAHSPDAALGVAVVCAVGRTVSLNALRRGARRYAKAAAGRLCAQPAMLVLLRALPPASLGLAEALQLPSLTPEQPERTLDLRASSSVDGATDYESSQRAAARKAASQRASARRAPRGDGLEATAAVRFARSWSRTIPLAHS